MNRNMVYHFLILLIQIIGTKSEDFSIHCNDNGVALSGRVGDAITPSCATNKDIYDCEISLGQDTCLYRKNEEYQCAAALKDVVRFVGNLRTCAFAIKMDSGSSEWLMTIESNTGTFNGDFASRSFVLEWLLQTYTTMTPHEEPRITYDTSCFLKDVDFKGEDLASSHTSSAEECQNECKSNAGCLYWTWVESADLHHNNRKCWMKASMHHISITDGWKGIVSGPRHCPMCYLVGTALKFDIHSKLKSIASVERCHERCQLANGCTHFTFKGSSCYLKTNNSTSLPDKDAISGPKHCPTARWSPWSQWSNHCEGICDNGTNYRIRECLRDMNHASCLGNSKETRICDLPLCPNKTEGKERQPNPASHSKPKLIIGILTALAVILVLASVVLVHRMSKRRTKMEHHEMKERIQIEATSASKRPINLTDIKEGKIVVQKEFMDLKDEDFRLHSVLFSTDVAKASCGGKLGVSFNRYTNILPYDRNRVSLKIPIQGCDYVNASWIQPLDQDSTTFIAAQGPTRQSLEHFLQMIVENQVQLVVMLTKLEEQDGDTMVEKCERYWSTLQTTAPLSVGSIRVNTLVEEPLSHLPGVNKRVFQVTKGNMKPHQVTQYQFTAWPDFGVPDNARPLVQLVKLIQGHEESELHNVLVHCSAGVGRTGTFIALYRLIQDIDFGAKEIDIFSTVLALRRERCQMVQSKEQYKFLYECVKVYIDEAQEQSTSDFIYVL